MSWHLIYNIINLCVEQTDGLYLQFILIHHHLFLQSLIFPVCVYRSILVITCGNTSIQERI